MLLSPTEAYKVWAAEYDATPNPLLALEARQLLSHLRGLQGETVVDVGCGTGRWMDRQIGSHVQMFGVDPSEAMLQHSTRKPRVHGRVAVADETALPFPAAFADLILCCFVVSYFRDLYAACAEMARVTKSSGHLVISDLHPEAVKCGWRRTFKRDGVIYQIEHAVYTEQRFRSVLQTAGWRECIAMDECFSEQDRSLFVIAGKEGLFEEASRIPAVRIGIYSRA